MSLQSHDAVKNKKHMRRPKKSQAERAQRQKVQKNRLLAMGYPKEKVDKMSPLEIRNKVVRPAEVAKELAAEAAK
ncbi:MAG: hypothetical protein GX804_08800 [Lentisphaerae bacterium]|jgi:hypothetical protein|nr:hypothetical protein [Lentisphaerota bacterium]